MSPLSVPSSPVMKRRGGGGANANTVERACCLTLTYSPLVFVYGLTTWAVCVEVGIGFLEKRPWWTGTLARLRCEVVMCSGVYVGVGTIVP
jgi:palmitoyltransferase